MWKAVSSDDNIATTKCDFSAIADANIPGIGSLRKIASDLAASGVVCHAPLDGNTLSALDSMADSYGMISRLVPRGGGFGEIPACDKLDARMKEEWICALDEMCPMECLRLRTLLDDAVSQFLTGIDRSNISVFWNVMFTFAGSCAQELHADNADAEIGTYATIILNLAYGDGSGGTEFPLTNRGQCLDVESEEAEIDRWIQLRDDPVCFSGHVLHRGGDCAKNSEPRISLMITITDGKDPNDVSSDSDADGKSLRD